MSVRTADRAPPSERRRNEVPPAGSDPGSRRYGTVAPRRCSWILDVPNGQSAIDQGASTHRSSSVLGSPPPGRAEAVRPTARRVSSLVVPIGGPYQLSVSSSRSCSARSVSIPSGGVGLASSAVVSMARVGRVLSLAWLVSLAASPSGAGWVICQRCRVDDDWARSASTAGPMLVVPAERSWAVRVSSHRSGWAAAVARCGLRGRPEGFDEASGVGVTIRVHHHAEHAAEERPRRLTAGDHVGQRLAVGQPHERVPGEHRR